MARARCALAVIRGVIRSPTMVQYDPSVIQKHADQLYASANMIILFCTLVFGLIGAGFFFTGAVGGAVGVILGIVLGYAVGTAIAFAYKLKAQMALCQMKIEERLRYLAVGTTQTGASVAAVEQGAAVAQPRVGV